MDDAAKQRFGDKLFCDLDAEEKKAFWNYQLMVIDIDPRASRKDIINMFNRLNLTDYNLNDQEKRNSKSGEFAALARQLSDEAIWDKNHLFTASDVKRMKDVEFCASLVLLHRKGIIDQTDQTELNVAYEDLREGYKDGEKDKEAVIKAMDVLPKFFTSDEALKFLRKKTQLYTVFSIIFSTQNENMDISDGCLNNFQRFVELYSHFTNDMDLELDDNEKKYFDWLKKYKLASSEGINKHTNRMIRFNVLKEFLFTSEGEISIIFDSLIKKMSMIKSEEIEDPEE